MRIETSVGKKTTSIRWRYLDEKISLKFPGRVEAEFSESKNLIIAASDDGLIRLIALDGSIISEFSYDNSDSCRFYVLTNSVITDLGVTMVMAHDPEYKGERFWQHGIDIEAMKVGGPLDKWR